MRSIVAAGLCSLVLSGCTLRQPHGDVELGPDQSMIVISTRVNDTCGGAIKTVMLGTQLLHGNEISSRTLLMYNSFLKSDFSDPPGTLFNQKIESGQLRFTKLVRSGTNAGFLADRELGFQMTIEPGKIYYLGELYLDIHCNDYNIRISDQRKRDGALFDQRMNTLDSSMFEVHLLGTK